MSNFWKIGLSFAAGLVIGGFATKKYIESKYEFEDIEELEEDLEQTEIEKEDNKILERVQNTVNEKIDYRKIKSVNDAEYTRLLDDLRYREEAATEDILGDMLIKESDTEPIDKSKPYNISPDEFEVLDDYESDEYTYYADGYVTDSYGMPVPEEDVINILGVDFEDYFGTYDDNQIWVRNERLSMDFSVIRDLDRFIDVVSPRIRRIAGL